MTPKYQTEGRPTAWEHGDQALDLKEKGETRVIILERTDQRADEYILYEDGDGTGETIFSHYSGRYPEDDVVYRVVYQNAIDAFLARIDADVDASRLLAILTELEIAELENTDGWGLDTFGFPESRFGRVA